MLCLGGRDGGLDLRSMAGMNSARVRQREAEQMPQHAQCRVHSFTSVPRRHRHRIHRRHR